MDLNHWPVRGDMQCPRSVGVGRTLHRTLLLAMCLWAHSGLAQEANSNLGSAIPTSQEGGGIRTIDDALVAPPAAGGSANTLESQVAAPTAAVDNLQQIARLRADVSTRKAAVEADPQRTQEAKASLIGLYDQTLEFLASAERNLDASEKWKASIAGAAQLLQSAQQAKEAVGEPVDQARIEWELAYISFDDATIALQELESQLSTAKTKEESLNRQVETQKTRRQQLPRVIADVRNQLEALQNSAVAAESPPVGSQAEAEQWLGQAKRIALSTELLALEREQEAIVAESPALPVMAANAAQQRARLQERVKVYKDTLAKRRASLIDDYRLEFSKHDFPEGEPAFETIRGWLARGSDDLPEGEGDDTFTWFDLARAHEQLRIELEDNRRELARWRDQRTRMKNRIEPDPKQENGAGSNRWVVQRLRGHREELPRIDGLNERLSRLQFQLQRAESLDFDLGDVQNQLQIETPDAGATAGLPPESLKVVSDILAAIKRDTTDYTNDLILAADDIEQTIDLVEDYQDFIDKQLLWTPSAERFGTRTIKDVAAATLWLLEYEKWLGIFGLLIDDARAYPIWYLIAAVGCLALLLNLRKIRQKLVSVSKQASRKTCTDHGLSVYALLYTVVIALPVPLLFLFLAWRLRAVGVDSEGSDFARSLADGLLLATASLFPMSFLRQVCRQDGLGTRHFDWRAPQVQSLSRHLRWLIDFSVPLLIVVGLLASHSEVRWDQSLGRLAFLGLMVILSVFFALVLKPSTGIFSGYIQKNPDGWVDRLRYLWYSFLVAAPLVLAFMSFLGYHYTAQQFAARVDNTLWMVVFVAAGYYMVNRWLVLNRRQIMMDQARQRLVDASQGESTGAIPIKGVDKVDLLEVSEQTKRLTKSLFATLGLVFSFWIWADVLPAVSLLERVELWEIDVGSADSSEKVSITLANLVWLLPILVLTTIATRNVPGLLEIAFLQHLPMTNASRYAITTLARYMIVGLGIVMAANAVALRWSSVQWLVAGLGVGLGFGLQEIFANFISGIILLFEQPIRVNDIVTIDGVTGSVAKIRMRATTIVNWDRQELIVPNKELITGKLINWTLSDTTNRVVINVGVAYGSDTQKACELVRQVCDQHTNVMKNPEPIVTFEGFGDNTLNLVLRAYLETLEFRLRTIHELHERIYLAFKEADIEIAFPQRDLHIRSLPQSITKFFEEQKAY